MTTTTTRGNDSRVAHSRTARYLPLWTFRGRGENHGRMHLAKVKSTKRPVAVAWCGRTYFVGRPGESVTGWDAFLLYLAGPEGKPTCERCLDRIGVGDPEW